MTFAYHYNWSVLWSQPYITWWMHGIRLTLEIGFFAWIIALSGIFIGTLRSSSSGWLHFLPTAYTEIFRNVPFLVQLFMWYFAFPMIFPDTIRIYINHIIGFNYYIAIIALGLYTASRIAEHMRAGLASIETMEYEAALSTGMTRYQMYRHVIIPHALIIIIPTLTTEFLTIFKNSSVAMTIGVAETTFTSYRIASTTFHGLEATTGAMTIYLLLSLTIVKISGIIESKVRIPGMAGR